MQSLSRQPTAVAPKWARLASSSSAQANGSGGGGNSFFPTNSFSQARAPAPLPHNSQWFTARPSLSATLQSLNKTVTASRTHLFKAGLLPAIDAPLNGTEAEFGQVMAHPRQRRWKDTKEMATYLRNGTDLRSSQYKQLTSVLSHLEGLLPYAELADALAASNRAPHLVVDPVAAAKGRETAAALSPFTSSSPTLRDQLEDILDRFQQPPTISATGVAIARVVGKERRLGKKDALGRVMAVGRRKESGARVWIVPAALDGASQQELVPGRVLVNSTALPTYFALPSHRTAAVRPLTLTSSLGAFNVFAIVKGGGIAAQADAVAMGIARALAEWERCEIEAGKIEEGPETWRDVLKKGQSWCCAISISTLIGRPALPHSRAD